MPFHIQTRVTPLLSPHLHLHPFFFFFLLPSLYASTLPQYVSSLLLSPLCVCCCCCCLLLISSFPPLPARGVWWRISHLLCTSLLIFFSLCWCRCSLMCVCMEKVFDVHVHTPLCAAATAVTAVAGHRRRGLAHMSRGFGKRHEREGRNGKREGQRATRTHTRRHSYTCKKWARACVCNQTWQ